MCIRAEIANPDNMQLHEAVTVLLDTGSQSTYIDEATANRLQIIDSAPLKTLNITTFNTDTRKIQVRNVDIAVKVNNGHQYKIITANTIPSITKHQQIAPINLNDLQRLRHYKVLQKPLQWEQPALLLGNDYYSEFITGFEKLSSGFYCYHSLLGPLITGKGLVKQPYHEFTRKGSTYCISTDTDVDNFWKLESVGITDNPHEKEDDLAIEHFQKTITRNAGRYVIQWPWRQPAPPLAENFGLCMGRLRSLWTKLSQNPKLLSDYNETVKTQLQDGIIEIADNKNNKGLVHYLPHQPVITPNKTTTKLRVVYDASAHTSGASLNEALLRGPVLLPDLCGILLRW